MSGNTISLDEIRAAADAKYGHLDIPLHEGYSARLLNVLRLPKEKRAELLNLQERINEEGSDQEALLEQALKLVAATEVQGERLVEALGGDLAMLVTVFEKYTAGTSVGEASASAS